MKLKMMRIGMVLAVLMSLIVMPANAQILNSNVASTNLSMTVNESITVNSTPGTVTFTYNALNGTATASGPITVVTTANIGGEYSFGITVLSWLSSSSAALSGPSNIPSSDVFTSVNGSTPAACTMTNNGQGLSPVANAGCFGSSGNVLDALATHSTAGQYVITDNVTVSLAGLSALTPGVYAGVINFAAQAS